MLVLLLVRYDEADRSGDNCHWKDSSLLTDPRSRGHATSLGGNTGKHVGQSRRRGSERETWTRKSLIVVSSGGSGRGRVSRPRIGWLELQGFRGVGAVPRGV